MVAYALLKGCRLSMRESAYQQAGAQMMESVLRNCIETQRDVMHLVHICASAGLGTFNGRERDGAAGDYVSEPQAPDNHHGVAALMMAYAEFLRAQG